MKKIIGKIVSLCLSLVLLAGFGPNSTVLAATSNTPESTLTQYLNSLKKQDVITALPYYTDSRAGNDSLKETILRQALSDSNQQISKFSILKRYSDDINSVIILANVEYTNGEITQVPFKLDKVNEKWLVRISSDLPVASQYKVIKQGNEIVQNNTVSTQLLQPMSVATVQKVTWDFTLSDPNTGSADQQYSSNFSVSSSNSIEVNFRQWEDYDTANIEYAIVKWGLFSDTVYASRSVIENNQGYADQVYLSVSSNLTGVCLRVKHLNVTYTAYSWGEVYN